MLDFLIVLELLLAAAVFGYAFACTAVVHPAMMAVSRSTAVEYFKPFFHKSAHLQMGLSLAILVVAVPIGLFGGPWQRWCCSSAAPTQSRP